MAAVRRYLFDDRFDEVEPIVRGAHKAARHDEASLRAHENLARADGFEAGRVAAREETAALAAEAVQQIAARLAAALASADEFVARTNEDAAELAIAAANQLAGPAAPPRFAAHTKERLAAVIAEQIGSPRLVIGVAPAMQPHVQAAADHVVGSSAYTGRVEVVADAALGGCDLTIDWQTGALAELRRDRLAALAQKITEYFAVAAPEGEA